MIGIRGRRRGKGRRLAGLQVGGGLKLTSMMDILTSLLLFLLKSFVAEPQVVAPASGVALPVSASDDRPEDSIVIVVSNEGVTVGGETVASLEAAIQGSPETLDRMQARLDALGEQSRELQRLRGETGEVAAKVTIQGDRQVPYGALRQVLRTVERSGQGAVALAVLEDH